MGLTGKKGGEKKKGVLVKMNLSLVYLSHHEENTKEFNWYEGDTLFLLKMCIFKNLLEFPEFKQKIGYYLIRHYAIKYSRYVWRPRKAANSTNSLNLFGRPFIWST